MNAVLVILSAIALAGCAWLIGRGLRKDRRSVTSSITAAVAGVIAYCLVQSAVERRLVVSLLLPVWDGVFLPGRMALLFTCIFLCLCLALTERGRGCMVRLGVLCEVRWGRWLCSAVVTGLFFVWTLRVNLLCYLTMDDVTILRTVAAVPREGLRAAAGAWSNILLCALIAFFYKLAPDGYWYLGYHLTMLLLSLVILGRCILFKAQKAGLHPLAGIAVHAALCVGLFSYAFGGLSFTITPAVAGSAAVALMMCRENETSLPSLILADAAGVLLMFFCRLQRYSTMRAVICFWLLAAVYSLCKLLMIRSDGWKKSAASLAVTTVMSLVLCFANVSAGMPSQTNEYYNAEYYRSVVMDYLMDNLTDEQWQSVGIPPELAVMMRGWYFMDERINTEMFRELTELYYETENTGANVMGTNSAAETAVTVRKNIVPVAAGLGFSCLLAMVSFARFGKKRWPELLCALGAAGGAAILCGYLIHEGRFPLRVFLVVAIPASVVLSLTLLSFPDGENTGRRGLKTISAVLIAAVAVSCGAAAMGSPRAGAAVTREELFAEQWSMEEYAGERPDTTFYTNMTGVTLDPLHGAYTYPENIHVWGGSFFTVDDDHPCADEFFRENVRLIVKPMSSLIAFLQYLTLDNGPVRAVQETRLANGICVVRIERVSPGDTNYTGWYESDGFTYYFENGQAAVGERWIDDTEYFFAPAGAASTMAAQNTEEGVQVYTTDSYSLVQP